MDEIPVYVIPEEKPVYIMPDEKKLGFTSI